MSIFIRYFKNKRLKNPVIVSPDVGGAKAAKKFADSLNYPLAILNKVRPGPNISEVTHIVGDIKGRTAIIYDDMIDTAGSVWKTKEALTKHGANKDVYLVATHPIFSDPAIERIKKSQFKEVIVTNTIPLGKEKKFPGLKIISIANLVAGIIRNVYEEKSVTSLYGEMVA